MSRCQKRTSGLYGAREINRGKDNDHPAGCHSIRTNQCPPPSSPIFLRAGCPSCRPTNSVKALKAIRNKLEMWANAQCDGRPAEYRWRPLFNAAKFGWCPLLECHAVTLPRCKTRWNLQGCTKLANRSQLLVGRSSPYYQDMWRRYCCLISFFPIVDTCLSSEDIARQSCAMVPKWWFFASCISSEPHAAHFRPAF